MVILFSSESEYIRDDDVAPRPSAAAPPVCDRDPAVRARRGDVRVRHDRDPAGRPAVPMAHGLSVSESTIGLLMTAYAGAAALTAIPLTVLASRVPRRRC